ncbi:fructose-6-phosphate aldolase [Halobacillus naozhouensis]|uniref:Probable transaldolase n=1 Tax=Halobacillus naozhouensis TaxID=554880 RepID=A0ABY8IZZ2_9BACI|nr:fructose-6-phosphate aldolase [Halobacillus naozhouensis]WFT74196.1 fructose-6-phosphate aldolase [Halobacillus naozhouensis]
MEFFLDTANMDEINRIKKIGLVNGITTNPTIISKENRDFKEIIIEICDAIKGPVSAEVIGLSVEEMINEARDIAQWAPNIVVKIPMTEAGLEAVSILAKEGIKTNVTLIFSVAQGLMAAKAGATYISPFIGRIDDMGEDGIELIRNLKQTLSNYDYHTKIITASIRTINHLEKAAVAGADIATIPGSIFPKLWSHPLTDKGIKQFSEDWGNVPNTVKS